MQLGTPRRVSGFTPAQAAAITQGLSLIRSLGGVAYAPQLSLATVNSDGSGGLSSIASPQALGLVQDVSGGIGIVRDFLSAQDKALDSARWVNLGSTPGWVISGGQAQISATAAGNRWLNSVTAIPVGSRVLVTFQVTAFGGTGVVTVDMGNAAVNVTGVGAYSCIVESCTTSVVQVFASAAVTSISIGQINAVQLVAGAASAATQATTANKPTLGPGALPGFGSMVFDGADWLETSALAATNTEAVYCAVRPSAGAVSDFAGRGNTAEAGQFGFRRAADNSALFFTYNGSGYGIVNSAPGTLANGTLAVLCGVKSPSRTYLRLNGTEVGSQTIASAANPASRALQIGRSLDGQNFVGLHAFAAWVPTEPTAAQHTILENCARAFAGMPLL